MKKLKPLFGFGCKSDGNGLVSIDVDCVENPVKLTTTFQSKLTTISGAN
jgi:hypothetical protein